MPRSDDEGIDQPVTPRFVGMPAPESVVSEKIFTPPVDARRATRAIPRQYRILVTNETDPYDRLERAVRRTPGDKFMGTARKAAKISIADAEIEEFDDLKDLIDSLPADEDMERHDPEITTGIDSGRVEEENRNVRVRTFLYAASREDDNDFHLILGRAPGEEPPMFMTMELSGLPSTRSASFRRLKAARDAYKGFFGEDLPGERYQFYPEPFEVDIEGSLFFDMSHATGSHPGPQSLRAHIPTIWEVHPITEIVFEP